MTDADLSFFAEARRSFHAALLAAVLRTDSQGVPTNADKASKLSVALASGIMARIGTESVGARLAGQMAGSRFEAICAEYLDETFAQLQHLRPGNWKVSKGAGEGNHSIARFD